jgi:cellobiose-specific phosphotransferase system component IIA
MLNPHDDRTISAKTATVLEALKKNLAEHADLVKEAREGYLQKAEVALAKRIQQLREGQVVALTFSLMPPQDHSNSYRTVIKMLELHLEAGEATI